MQSRILKRFASTVILFSFSESCVDKNFANCLSRSVIEVLFWVWFLGHARSRDEELVTASKVYFTEYSPRQVLPGQPSPLSLRHILDQVRESSTLLFLQY